MGFVSQLLASVAGGAIGGSFVLWGVNLQSQRQGEAACRALLIEVQANISTIRGMIRERPRNGGPWPQGKPNPGWLSRSVWDSQLPYIVQQLDASTLESVVKAYGTLDPIRDMRAKSPQLEFTYGGWMEQHIAWMDDRFSSAERQLHQAVARFKPFGELIWRQVADAIVRLRQRLSSSQATR